MTQVLENLPHGARVAVIRLRSLGDCVLTTPALEILKGARPDLQLGVVVEDRFAPVFEGNPIIESILPVSVSVVRRWRPRLALNLHGGSRSARLTALSGARFRAGFEHFPYAWIYNVKIPRAQQILGEERTVHTAEHLASAMFYLGAPRCEIPRARLYARDSGPGHPYAVIHPAASDPAKTWPAERFVETAEFLRRQMDLEPVFVGGPNDDLRAFAAYRTLAGAPLSRVKSLLKDATLFLGNDSGPAHIAAAFGVPVVVIFGSSDPVVWAPWKTAHQSLVAGGSIESISAQAVFDALERLRVAA